METGQNGSCKRINVNPGQEATMENGDIRYTACWYGKDAIDSDVGEINSDKISSDVFINEREAVSAAKLNAFKSGVVEWCQVSKSICVNARYGHWDNLVTTTFSRWKNKWSVDQVENHS